MLSLSELKPGVVFAMDGDPWQVLEAQFVKMAQRTGHVEAKIRNLRIGNVLTRSFKQADRLQEAEVKRVRSQFVFGHRGRYVFSEANNPARRFEFSEERIGEERFYLVPKLELTAFEFSGEILAIELPPKVDLRVTEAPPWVKGDTASGGTKTVLCETGLKVQTPPFIEAGAVIRVNTRTGAYVERVEK
ncbi:MAG: hypothetical protein A2991_03605 [Candidatus Terrybacteria bacterium RIFCSPLOWO2_01_FULL_58_14]|uniref:Elongation factor P C-terminal domain-containing protein n=2 Tax=Candidatus Terryibacteriota TaxID=1817920 RepID=A0A1G2PVH4_9BACT|nr:MAG: hypothetical protein A2682_00755 [Candidatus Terrybacteria bacterium RIFCSPHIGHO2_01_FULL_58_15]OHA52328.1 MAG: hypothetical protein A2991_03605 [Candidatus Terrybacteria bacterium RIFCSPLOWO2_01_FULL_58_14]